MRWITPITKSNKNPIRSSLGAGINPRASQFKSAGVIITFSDFVVCSLKMDAPRSTAMLSCNRSIFISIFWSANALTGMGPTKKENKFAENTKFNLTCQMELFPKSVGLICWIHLGNMEPEC